jgi:hypothetical protein
MTGGPAGPVGSGEIVVLGKLSLEGVQECHLTKGQLSAVKEDLEASPIGTYATRPTWLYRESGWTPQPL